MNQNQLTRIASDVRTGAANARRAAEALFAPKGPSPHGMTTEASEAGASSPPRKPRVLRALLAAPAGRLTPEDPVAVAASPDQPIPAPHVAQIRTWLEYGMTIPQVARIYGVAVSVIERLL